MNRRTNGITTLLLLLVAAAPVSAQVTAAPPAAKAPAAKAPAAKAPAAAGATIDPGMTRAQVIARLGEPLSTHSFESYTYLFYRNGCEQKCGMNDLVVLDSGKVVDAVFRSPQRRYTGTSSSPRAIPAAEVRAGPKPRRPALSVPPPKKPAPNAPAPKKPAHD